MAALVIRRATRDDLDFVVTALVAAERSGRDYSLYERLFGLDEAGLRALLVHMIDEDIPGSELHLGSFRLAVDEDRPVGAIATWREAVDEPPSHIVRATLLADALGARWTAAMPRIKLLAEVDIPRAAGALQIESVHVVESHRGRRIAATLIEDALAEERPPLAQILSLIENTASARAFEAAGFQAALRRSSESPELRALLPGSGRVLWERRR